jgi:LPXTG-site transpeptidase (sortase) family protein
MVRRRQRLALVCLVVGLMAMLAGFAILVNGKRVPSSHGPGPTRVIIPKDAFPGVGPGGPPLGMRIRIVDLGINLPVVEGDGWNAPLYKAATYPGLKRPGEQGRSVIYAHALPGMFGPLFKAKEGQLIHIDRADGVTLNYQIKQYFPHWSSIDIRWLQPGTQEELVLVTCTTYNPNDPRIVVVAEPFA